MTIGKELKNFPFFIAEANCCCNRFVFIGCQAEIVKLESFWIFNCCTGYKGADIGIGDLVFLVCQRFELSKQWLDVFFCKFQSQLMQFFDKGMATRQFSKRETIALNTNQLRRNDFVGKRIFKNSVLEAFGQVDPAKIGLSLLVALAMGILIYYVYKRFFTGVVYSRSFAVTLVGMCVLTCMVTLAISTNVVISLGMVGALSIVRYRTAVKDPLDLLYLFWAITTGITAGAGMYALVALTAVVIVVMIAGFASHQDKARVYMMVIHYTGQTTGDDIVRALGRTKFTVKSTTMRGDKVEMAVEVFSDGVDMPYADAIRALDGVEDLTLIQYNGEYHG